MTPIPISIKMGKRVAIGVDSIIVLFGEFILYESQQQEETF